MKMISEQVHPATTAVFSAVADSMTEAALKARTLIQLPEYDSVVVLTNSKTVSQTAEAAEQALNNRFRADHYYYIAREGDYDAEKGKTPCAPSEIREKYGPDFSLLTEFIRPLGPGHLSIRSATNGSTKHIDAGEVFRPGYDDACGEKVEPTSLLPYGVTVTMSVRGGGTRLIKAGRGELKRKYNSGRLVWEWKKTFMRQPKEWSVPDGGILLLRTSSWDEAHPPSVHGEPPRNTFADPRERIVGVARVRGQSRGVPANLP